MISDKFRQVANRMRGVTGKMKETTTSVVQSFFEEDKELAARVVKLATVVLGDKISSDDIAVVVKALEDYVASANECKKLLKISESSREELRESNNHLGKKVLILEHGITKSRSRREIIQRCTNLEATNEIQHTQICDLRQLLQREQSANESALSQIKDLQRQIQLLSMKRTCEKTLHRVTELEYTGKYCYQCKLEAYRAMHRTFVDRVRFAIKALTRGQRQKKKASSLRQAKGILEAAVDDEAEAVGKIDPENPWASAAMLASVLGAAAGIYLMMGAKKKK